MNLINKHLDKNNLHHAYLIEGKKEEILPEVLKFIKSIGIKTTDNQDFNQITLDSLKREDAKNLKSQSVEKGISGKQKVFIISVNNFLIEAQNTLLKMFEEPIENTIFFLIVPDASIILPTLLSRFYVILARQGLAGELKKEAEEFVKMSLPDRILFVKEMVAKPEDEEENDSENISMDSNRSKAIKFLNALETILHKRLFTDRGLTSIQIESKPLSETNYFEQIFKARVYLSQPGSSTKSLMESVALVVPQ
jgi:DNA polymerase-3 subunit delta'